MVRYIILTRFYSCLCTYTFIEFVVCMCVIYLSLSATFMCILGTTYRLIEELTTLFLTSTMMDSLEGGYPQYWCNRMPKVFEGHSHVFEYHVCHAKWLHECNSPPCWIRQDLIMNVCNLRVQ